MNLYNLKELEAKATPGEWMRVGFDVFKMGHNVEIGLVCDLGRSVKEGSENNGELICALRNSAKEMIETIERYKLALEKTESLALERVRIFDGNHWNERQQVNDDNIRDAFDSLHRNAREALKDPEKTKS